MLDPAGLGKNLLEFRLFDPSTTPGRHSYHLRDNALGSYAPRRPLQAERLLRKLQISYTRRPRPALQTSLCFYSWQE
jgi:hypothetical protein